MYQKLHCVVTFTRFTVKVTFNKKELAQPRFLTRKIVIRMNDIMVKEKHSPRFVR